MNKKLSILSSLLLIAAGVVVHILSDQSDGRLDTELIGFFAGILVGAGFSILLLTLFRKPGKNTNS